MAARTETVRFEEPQFARWLFASPAAAWIWLVARLYVGWEWFHAGWGKVFGGNITWKVWNWGGAEYSLFGDGNIGWVRSGMKDFGEGPVPLGIGDSVAGFAAGAIEGAQGPHPDVAYSWYVGFLEWIRDDIHPILGPVVAVGELVIGLALILGLFTGIAAFLGAALNFNFAFAGSAGVNPMMILLSILIVLAWRNAGWIGLDRYVLPKVGVPWGRKKAAVETAVPELERVGT